MNLASYGTLITHSQFIVLSWQATIHWGKESRQHRFSPTPLDVIFDLLAMFLMMNPKKKMWSFFWTCVITFSPSLSVWDCRHMINLGNLQNSLMINCSVKWTKKWIDAVKIKNCQKMVKNVTTTASICTRLLWETRNRGDTQVAHSRRVRIQVSGLFSSSLYVPSLDTFNYSSMFRPQRCQLSCAEHPASGPQILSLPPSPLPTPSWVQISCERGSEERGGKKKIPNNFPHRPKTKPLRWGQDWGQAGGKSLSCGKHSWGNQESDSTSALASYQRTHGRRSRRRIQKRIVSSDR